MRTRTTLRRAFGLVLATAAMGASLVVVHGAPAAAYTNHDGYCTSSEVCLYRDTSYHSCNDDYGSDISNYSGRTYADCASFSLNDSVSSFFNNAWYEGVDLYENSNYGGSSIGIGAGSGRTSMGVMDNAASSHYW
ncbi:MAG: hypothetical protein HOQ43_18025 [Glycomyces artemisiae]|uniref:Peptidase inhibitor family I36 n=1 Tax=Glycomyces artemisiae TaxID=1076443 RepID=A0A850CEB1_9ACTN|nr:hypothetical protein [Glycomyces artemisiae]